MPVEDPKETIAVPNIDLCNMRILHIASPPLHFSAAKPNLGVLSLMVFLLLIGRIVKAR